MIPSARTFQPTWAHRPPKEDPKSPPFQKKETEITIIIIGFAQVIKTVDPINLSC